MAGVRGEVEQLVVGAEDNLDLFDRAAIAAQPVVDAAPDEAAAELGQGPAKGRALADLGLAMLERDGFGREVLDRGDLEGRAGREVDLERSREQRLPGFRRRGRGRLKLLDATRSYMKGLIVIEPTAVGTDSFLGEFGMNLSKQARADLDRFMPNSPR